MNKLKLTFKEIASRLTGFSIPIFGVSWQPDEWRPQPTHQRKTVAGVFRLPNNTWIEQRQTYRKLSF